MALEIDSTQSARRNVWLLQCLFFFSGAAGLIYEVVWTRLFSDILGSTVMAMSVTFSIFLLSLAIGALLFGRHRASGAAALRLYGKLELAIGISCCLTSTILWFGRSWLASMTPSTDSFFISIGFSLLLCLLLIGMPTLLMGGTLPVILAAARAWESPRSVVTRFYGWNTVGAAIGTLASGFLLIWQLGLILTLATAISVNLLVGVLALLLSRHTPVGQPSSSSPSEFHPPITTAREPLWIVLALLSGFGVLGCEILWARMARFLLGDRTIAISAVLFIFIVSLGLASLAVPSLSRRAGNTSALQLIAFSLLIGGLLHLVSVPLARATIGGGGLAPLLPISNEFLRRILISSLLIAPPVFVLGLVFPLLCQGAKQLNQIPGRIIGELYFVNTVGAFLGAISASYLLSRSAGTLGGFLILTGLLVAAAVALVLSKGNKLMKTLALFSILLFLFGAYRFPLSMIELRADEQLLASNEDEYGVQVLTQTRRNTMRVRNNRLQLIYDLGHPQTTHAQQMGAHLTVLLGKGCDEVLNIGTGYGITAGTYTLYESVRSVRSIEILPFLVQHQRQFSPYNFDFLDDPRVQLTQGDGRHYLAADPKRYDIISVNVLDPYLPGSSSLYTVEFWRMASKRLKPGGVFTQLFWGNDLDLLAKGLRRVFPSALYFPAYGNTSFNVVAFKEPVNAENLKLKLDRLNPAVEKEIRKITGREGVALFRNLLREAWNANPYFEELAASTTGQIHTDNYPILEYRWAHGINNVSNLDSPLVEQ